MEHHNITYHTVPRETFSAVDELIEEHRSDLSTYIDQLLWWNERINLVSRDVSRGTIWEHIRHSLLLSQFEPFQEAEFIVDAGTGGGLPGIPLAIATPDKEYLLNDIVSKKIIAVRQTILNLSLENAKAKALSISKVQMPSPTLLISKHAFKIEELWDMISEKPWSSMVFYKGIDFEDELENIGKPLDVDCHDLSEESDFYEGKALVIVNRL